ncbi:MAG: protein-export chaperone SecB, partial [Deltaproteobacteria bacterium]|nr:protein-export chaperone SecB [Deltaproteobacteria bacterium]
SISNGNMPFSFDVVGEGRFVFKTIPDEQTLTRVAVINGPAIIYPYVRETIADMSRRAGFPPLHLPPVNFVRLATNKQTLQKKEGK